MATINWPWAIILCRYSDRPAEPQPPSYYAQLFTESGTGGMCDYWHTVSCGTLDLTRSQVFGWFQMAHASSEVGQLVFPGDRGKLVQWGIDAARANGVDLSPFRNILVVHNYGVDHGAAGNGIVIVHANGSLCEYGFISHEMGHGFGLPHSLSANPDTVYGDGWDVMSFATTTFQFPITFEGSAGVATVGLNARNLDALGAVPPGRTWTPPGPDFSGTVTLDPLNQPLIGNHGDLIVKIPPAATRPARPSQSTYTVEFRRKAGWDQAIPKDAVSIHEIRANGNSYLQPAMGGQFVAGDRFVTTAPAVHIQVTSIDSAARFATLRIWDLPEGCLRKEDSKPQVYLLQNGTKRWVTSPAVLFALGRTWADVRSVPDGALAGIPDGADVVEVVAPTTTEVPDVRESNRAGAAADLRAADLVPKFTGSGTWVASQAPAAGAIVPRGSTVTCRMRRGPRP